MALLNSRERVVRLIGPTTTYVEGSICFPILSSMECSVSVDNSLECSEPSSSVRILVGLPICTYHVNISLNDFQIQMLKMPREILTC